MVDNNIGSNSQTGSNPGPQGPTYHDWREQRWQMRQKARAARRSRPFHGLFGGLVLVLLGVLFLAGQQNWITGSAWWQWLLVGLGAISIVSGLVQYHAPEYSHSRRRRFVWGVALVALGTIFLLGFSHWWPAVLIGAGVAVLLSGLW
jgi:cation transport ATPase